LSGAEKEVVEDHEPTAHPVLPRRDQLALGGREIGRSFDQEPFAKRVLGPHNVPDLGRQHGIDRMSGRGPRERRDDLALLVHPRQQRSPCAVEQRGVFLGQDHAPASQDLAWRARVSACWLTLWSTVSITTSITTCL